MQFWHFVVAAFELIKVVFQKESYTADDLLSTSQKGRNLSQAIKGFHVYLNTHNCQCVSDIRIIHLKNVQSG